MRLVPGDKVLFVEKPNDEVVVTTEALSALAGAQEAFAGAAEDFGAGDEGDVQALVDEVRGRGQAS